jgi:hypothetical protein
MIAASSRHFLISLSAAATLAFGSPAHADDIRVASATVPVAFTWGTGDSAKVDGKLEASGVEPIGNGRLVLVAHDKTEPLYVVETATGRILSNEVTCKAFPHGLATGPKWEGMARDDDGNYYIIGAHSGKTDAERAEKAYLFRFRIKGGVGEAPVTIDESSVVRWQVAAGLASALAKQVQDPALQAKLKIEGLTIWKRRDAFGKPRVELVVGLREPSDLVRTFSADITATPAAGGELTFNHLFSFPAGTHEGSTRQLTSLLHLPAWNGFIVATATEDSDNVFHGNTLWFVADDQIKGEGNVTPIKVTDFEAAMKCEGLSELPGSDVRQARLVATYDNDPHATKIPSRIQTMALIRRP